MKLSTRILASACSLAVATTMLTATYASADREFTAPSISSAGTHRITSYNLKANEVYSTLKNLPDEPTVGISVQMQNYNFRNVMSAGNYDYLDGTNVYVNGEKYHLTVNSSTWAYFFVHGATVMYDENGTPLLTKKGKETTLAVAQPGGTVYYLDANGNETTVADPNNVPEGITTCLKAAEVNDAVIKGAGTYKASIVGHDFSKDTSSDPVTGFRTLLLTSNIGYFNGQVNVKDYTVDATNLNSVIADAESFLTSKKAELETLKQQVTEAPAEEPTTEAVEPTSEDDTTPPDTTEPENNDTDVADKIAELEEQIANIESAIATAKEAATKSGAKLAGNYVLALSDIKVNFYDSAESYASGTPDRQYPVTGFFTTGMNGDEEAAGKSDYNFTEYRLISEYSKMSEINKCPTSPSAVTKDENGIYSGFVTGNITTNTADGGESFPTVKGLDYVGNGGSQSNATGATEKLPQYALEVEFSVNDAEVFGYQGAIDDASAAVTKAVADAGGLIWSKLDNAIKDAEAKDASQFTAASYEKLTAAVQAAKDLKAKYENDPSSVTQDEIDAATQAIIDAMEALEPLSPTNPDNGSGSGSSTTNGSGSSKTDSNPSTGAGVAVTAATALLVGAGFVISRKRK